MNQKISFCGMVLSFLISLFPVSAEPVQTWDGPPRPPEQTVILEIPYTVSFLSVDGEDFSNFTGLFGGKISEFAVLPGHHTLELQYYEMFDTGIDDHESIRSDTVPVTFDGVAGQRYRLTHPPQETPDAAKEFARNPRFEIQRVDPADTSTGDAGSAVQSSPRAVSGKKPSDKTSKTGNTSGSDRLDPLEQLKMYWRKATPEERAAFLQYIAGEKQL